LTAQRDAKRRQLQKLSGKSKKPLTQQDMDLQGSLAVELENLKKQLIEFKKHKQQIAKQRAYIRKCEENLAPMSAGMLCVCVCVSVCVRVCTCVYVRVEPGKHDVIVWQDFVSQYNIHGKKVLRCFSF
jgi:hypothetical protein